MAASWRPEREVEVVAGTPPGGGLDRTARALAKAIESHSLLDVPIRVVNIPGDGARNAWRHVERHAGDAHVLSISSPNLTTDRLVGLARFDHSSFTPLAVLCTEYIAFIARSDSALRSGADLLRQLASDAARVTVALSTALGNPNHIALAKLIRHVGGDVKAPGIRVFDSALDAVADVVAGNADVAAVTAASAVKELAGQSVRALAVSAPERLSGPLYGEVPTWNELSVDCVIGAWRGVSGARDLTSAQIAFWEQVIASAVSAREWTDELGRHYWTALHLDGARLRNYLAKEAREMRTVLEELGLLRS